MFSVISIATSLITPNEVHGSTSYSLKCSLNASPLSLPACDARDHNKPTISSAISLPRSYTNTTTHCAMADPFHDIPAELLREIAEYIYPDDTSLTITRKHAGRRRDPRLETPLAAVGSDSFGAIYPPGASPYKGIIAWSYGPSLEEIMRSLSFSPSLLRAVVKTQVLAHKKRITAEAPPLPPILTNYPFQMLQTLIIDLEAGPVNAYHRTEFNALEVGMRTIRESLPSLWSVKVNISWTKPSFKAYEAYERHPLPDNYVYELHRDLFLLLYSMSLHSVESEIVSNREILKFDHNYHGHGYLYRDGRIKERIRSARLIPYAGTTLGNWNKLFVKLEHARKTRVDDDDVEIREYKPRVQDSVFLLR